MGDEDSQGDVSLRWSGAPPPPKANFDVAELWLKRLDFFTLFKTKHND